MLSFCLISLSSCAKEDIAPTPVIECSMVIPNEDTGASYVSQIDGTWTGDYAITNSTCYDNHVSFTDTFKLVPWSGTFLKMTSTDTVTMTLYSDAFHFDDDPTTIWNINYVNDSSLCLNSTISGQMVIHHYKRE